MNAFRYWLTAAIVIIMSWTLNTTSAQKNIVIENDQLQLVIGDNAITKSLVYKPTNEECLIAHDSIPIFSVTQERPYHNEIKLAHPNKRMTFKANSIRREGNKLVVGFELVPYDAVIRIKETPDYIAFTFEDFIIHPNAYPTWFGITPPPATEICFLQLPIRNRKNFGEWLNVSWDDKIAVNVLGTDQYARIDADERNGYRILRADAVKDVRLRDVGAALIVTNSENLLDKIAQIEEDYNLPKGVKSRRDCQTKLSYYWSGNVNLQNLDQHLKYAKMGGFRNFMIYYPAFLAGSGYRNLGDYDYNKSLFPNGKDDLQSMLKKIEGAGLIPGLHVLHSHIGRDSRYVTPIPDHRLNMLRYFTLAKPLSMDDTEIYVSKNPVETNLADGTRVLKIGSELISFESFTTIAPYKFIGCKRGIDKTTINAQPVGYTFGLLDVSEFGATSVYIDQDTDLQDEVAEKIADIYRAGFKYIYFDGSEGVNDPFWFHVASAQHKVFKRLEPQPLFAEGAAKTHFSWHMLSGGNAFDVFPPETLKEEIRKWPSEEAPRMQQDFTRINFGWLGYVVPNEKTIGTQPDMLEFVTSRAAAWDCPVSIQTNISKFEEHPRTADNFEVFRRWEEARVQNWLTDAQKKDLQDLQQEHILLLDEKGKMELQPYHQIEHVAHGSKEVRAFIFQRGADMYVVYWHTSGSGKMKLPLDKSKVQLFEKLGKKESFKSAQKGSIVIPVSNRRYLKATNMSKDQLINAFGEAEIIN
ncbi:MAG: hypothetical protein PHI32_00320 [Dysgonamonadaceae bacterium]|nr:hypothetical protein [Dysgonamonadaceae bacterium]MDD4727187.1 hypothetical protein [Dysgonamonadaceae bacterium]